MKKKITRSEASALSKEYNLSDAHTYQLPDDIENEYIFEKFTSIYFEAVQNRGPKLDRDAFEAFMEASQQKVACSDQWFLPTYAASISTEIIANALRGQITNIHLPTPTFDNIADIFKRIGFGVQPIPIHAADSYYQSILEAIYDNGSDINCIFLVLPNNPTGHNIERDELVELATFCKQKSITLIIDFCFRVFDYSKIYDQYKVLIDTQVQFITIEDTGKVWPTLDLKLSFICASEHFRESILSIYDDFLLNVSPFVSLLIKRYSELEIHQEFASMRSNTAKNRDYLRRKISGSQLPLEIPFGHSNLSVEVVRCNEGNFDSFEFSEFCLERGIGILSGQSFYWHASDLGQNEIRIALARPNEYFENAANHLFRVWEEYANELKIVDKSI